MFKRMPTSGFGEGRKAPEIHLGYFTRVRAVWNLLIRLSEVCHSKDKKLQVVTLIWFNHLMFIRLFYFLDCKLTSVSHLVFVSEDITSYNQ